MGISIAIPSADLHRVRLARNLLATKMPPGTEIFLQQVPYSLAIDKAREVYVRAFLEGGKTDRLWFCDDDMGWHPDSVMRLYERDLDIVAALTWTNETPPRPTIWDLIHEKEGQCFYRPQVKETLEWLKANREYINSNKPIVLPLTAEALKDTDATGAAFLLVKRQVFEAIEPPWFEAQNEYGFGEDFAFCRKAKEKGFKIYVDRSVIVTHIPRFPLGPLTFMAFTSLFREMTPEEEAKYLGAQVNNGT